MKKKFIKFILGLVQALIDLGIIASVLGAFGTLVIGVCALVDPHAFFGNLLTWQNIIQGLMFIITTVTVFFGALAAHRLLDNLNNEKYFVPDNCRALRVILWVAIADLVIQGITTIWVRLANLKPLNADFMLTGNDVDSALVFIIVLLIVYLIFQRGIALQEDENSII